jgi:hypothetical protein
MLDQSADLEDEFVLFRFLLKTGVGWSGTHTARMSKGPPVAVW